MNEEICRVLAREDAWDSRRHSRRGRMCNFAGRSVKEPWLEGGWDQRRVRRRRVRHKGRESNESGRGTSFRLRRGRNWRPLSKKGRTGTRKRERKEPVLEARELKRVKKREWWCGKQGGPGGKHFKGRWPICVGDPGRDFARAGCGYLAPPNNIAGGGGGDAQLGTAGQ